MYNFHIHFDRSAKRLFTTANDTKTSVIKKDSKSLECEPFIAMEVPMKPDGDFSEKLVTNIDSDLNEIKLPEMDVLNDSTQPMNVDQENSTCTVTSRDAVLFQSSFKIDEINLNEPFNEPLNDMDISMIDGNAGPELCFDEPIEKPLQEPIEQPAEMNIQKSIEQPSEPPLQEPIEKPVETTIQKLIEQPAETGLEEPIEQLAETPSQEPIEQFEEPTSFIQLMDESDHSISNGENAFDSTIEENPNQNKSKHVQFLTPANSNTKATVTPLVIRLRTRRQANDSYEVIRKNRNSTVDDESTSNSLASVDMMDMSFQNSGGSESSESTPDIVRKNARFPQTSRIILHSIENVEEFKMNILRQGASHSGISKRPQTKRTKANENKGM